MILLNRAKHLYSDKYIISANIKFELDGMYLYENNRWVECEEETRSINFGEMLDKDGKKIFASLSEDGKGGDTLYAQEWDSEGDLREDIYRNIVCVYYKQEFMLTRKIKDEVFYFGWNYLSIKK